MRARIALPLIMTLLGCTIILVEPQYSNSAPQKGGFGKKSDQGDGGGKGFGKGKMDPGKMFDDWMSKGRGFFLVEEARFGKDELLTFAKQNNITDGKITKDQYLKFWAMREELKAKKDGTDTAKGPTKGDFGKGFQKGGGGNPDDNTRADEMFKRYDKNEDGYLNKDEIDLTQRFKNEWEKWDKNNDKLISLAEWRDYFKDLNQRQTQAREERKGEGEKKTDTKVAKGVIVIEEDEAPLPPIFRAGGKLPAGVPTWFTELDKDKDGQVSLFEWKTGGKDIEEFVKMDRNDDGFLTIEEVLYYQNFVVNAGTPRANQTTVIAGQKRPDGSPDTGPRKKGGGKKKMCP